MFARLGALFGRLGVAIPAGEPSGGGGPDDPDDFTTTFLSMGQY